MSRQTIELSMPLATLRKRLGSDSATRKDGRLDTSGHKGRVSLDRNQALTAGTTYVSSAFSLQHKQQFLFCDVLHARKADRPSKGPLM